MTSENQTIRFRSASEIIRLAGNTPEFWVEPDAYLRYAPAIEHINRFRHGIPKILEVGSGNHGLNAYVSLPITKTDLALSKQKTGSQIIAAAETLPFVNSAFDLVCAIDLLEHVPMSSRWRIITELIRVSKRDVILVFPFGKKAQDSDLRLANEFQRAFNRNLFILEAHREFPFPEKTEIDSWTCRIKELGYEVQSKKSFGIFFRESLVSNWFQKKKCARFWAGRIIENKLLQKLISFGNCYRLVLWIQKHSDHNNHSAQSHNTPKLCEPL